MMKDDEIEVLFEDEEDIELEKKRKEAQKTKNNDEDFVKDPSLNDVFPDKDDVDIDRLLNKFEEANVDGDTDGVNEISEVTVEKISEKPKKKKMKLWQIILVIFICLALILGSGLAFLLYGPYPNFRNWLITTAMTTMSHKYLATWFYDDETINQVMQDNYVKESDEATDLNAISFVNYSNSKVMYKNKYEKEILTHEEGASYKLINIDGDGMRGYLIAIYDPSKVKVATASNMNSSGEMLTKIAEKNNALVAINASGFYDPWLCW